MAAGFSAGGAPLRCSQGSLPDHASRLTLERYARVEAMVPLLYFAIGINALAASLASQGDFPLLYQLILPAALIIASIIRLVIWRRRKHRDIDAATARRYLRRTFAIAVALSLGGGLWTLGAFVEVHESRRALTAFFILIAGVATAISLAPIPRAAPVCLGLALAPTALAMLASGDLGLQAIALSIALLAMLVIHQAAASTRGIDENLKLLGQLERQAWFDPLTGLANRRGFAKAFETARQDAGAADRMTLLIVDLDGFKAANDRFGHIAGDGVLVETARRLEELFPDAHLIARFGGDEFVALFVESEQRGDWPDRLAVAKRTLAMPVVDPLQTIPIGASFGMALGGIEEASLATLLTMADCELYRDKARRTPAAACRA